MELEIKVQGMTCDGCTSRVQDALQVKKNTSSSANGPCWRARPACETSASPGQQAGVFDALTSANLTSWQSCPQPWIWQAFWETCGRTKSMPKLLMSCPMSQLKLSPAEIALCSAAGAQARAELCQCA